MLYENIVLDSAYASQEVFVTSPNQEKEKSLRRFTAWHIKRGASSGRLEWPAASITVGHTHLLTLCPQTVSTYKTQGKGIMGEAVCKNKSLFMGRVQKAVGSALLVSKALLTVPGRCSSAALCSLRNKHVGVQRMIHSCLLILEDLYIQLRVT